MERDAESFISWMEGKESCNGGRREKSKPGTVEKDGSGETKAEVEGEETTAGIGAGEETVEGLKRVSATMFSGPGRWTMELVNSDR